MSKNNHYLVIGLGKIGLPVANHLAKQGQQVTVINRSPREQLDDNITFIQQDARYMTANELADNKDTIAHICIIVSPSESGEQGYRDSYFAISQNVVELAKNLPNLKRVVFISSTSVYGQNHGEIIDISTPIQPPTSLTAQVLIETEQLLQHHFGEKCTIIRPSGIYGKQRLRLINMVNGLAEGKIQPPQNSWTNRIFDSDLVTVIVNVLTEKSPLPIYLATDFAPVAMVDVLDFLAKTQGLSLTLPNDLSTTGKRLISNLPKNWLNYPNYQIGYSAICQAILQS